MNNKIKFTRNGDVNLHSIKELPKGLKEVEFNGKEWIMARGEATGSKHLLTVDRPDTLKIYQDEKGNFYFDLKAEAKASHTADHETTTVLPGIYVQVPEREVDNYMQVVRKVID